MKEITREQAKRIEESCIHEWYHDYGEDGVYEEWTKRYYNTIFENVKILEWYDNRIGWLYFIVNRTEQEQIEREIAEDMKFYSESVGIECY